MHRLNLEAIFFSKCLMLLCALTDISAIYYNTARGDESEKARCGAVDVTPSTPSGSKG